jgi:hypothetical protein
MSGIHPAYRCIARTAFHLASTMEKSLETAAVQMREMTVRYSGFWLGQRIFYYATAKSENDAQQIDDVMKFAILANVTCLSLLAVALITKHVSATMMREKVD